MEINLEVSNLSESGIFENDPKLIEILLSDHTTGQNIFWATEDYADLGDAFTFHAQIQPEFVKNGMIQPRFKKDRKLRTSRSKKMGEVFTPLWICNLQNNVVDADWFKRENVFNVEKEKDWEIVEDKIEFPEGKTWKDYLRVTCLEITCGEAHYLSSRYDSISGEFVPVNRRIGLLDRKLRVVNENADDPVEWLRAAVIAYQSIYGYEWQGDNLFLARESLLGTFLDNYRMKFGKLPYQRAIRLIAHIISWNLWQMDGLKGVLPNTCHEEESPELFGNPQKNPCPGCKSENKKRHNGIYARIRDWNEKTVLEYADLLKDDAQ